MSKINVSTITNRTGTSGPVLSGVTTATNGFHVTGGSVGIGTDNPGNDLEIASSGNSKGLIVTKNSVNSVFLGHNGSGNEGLLALREGGTTRVQLYAETGQNSYINAGNLGIGTNNPLRNLHIHSAAAETVAIQLSNGTTGTASDNSGFTLKIGSLGQVNLDQRTSGQDIIVYTNSVERMRVGGATGVTTFVKDVSITDGNLKVASGKGIDFSATGQATGMTNELLDDYEEGTFTVTSSGILNQGGLQTARYVKIGNLVTYMFNFYQNSNNMSWSAGSIFSISAFTPIANFHTSPSISWYKSASNSDTQPAYFNSAGDIVLNAAQSSVRHLWGFVTVEVQ